MTYYYGEASCNGRLKNKTKSVCGKRGYYIFNGNEPRCGRHAGTNKVKLPFIFFNNRPNIRNCVFKIKHKNAHLLDYFVLWHKTAQF